MKNNKKDMGIFTLNEVIYYKFYKKIEKQTKEDENVLEGIGGILDAIIERYELDKTFFDEAKTFYNDFMNNRDFQDRVKLLVNTYDRMSGRRYDKKIGDLCYEFFQNKKDYFEPTINDTYDDIISCVDNNNIHIFRKDLNPATFLSILNKNGCKIIIEDNDSNFKCNNIFVGYTDNEEKIVYSNYDFLKKYDFITPANIDKESFDLAMSLEILSDDGVLIYNTHAISMYKNDPKSINFRKYLIDNKMLKAIIFTKSYTRKTDYEAFYIITKEENSDVMFIDAGNNKYRKFYEIGEYSDEYEFGEDFNNIFYIIKNKISSHGVSQLVLNEDIINNDYRFDIDDYIIVDKESKFRSLEEIEEDIREIYAFIGDNLF